MFRACFIVITPYPRSPHRRRCKTQAKRGFRLFRCLETPQSGGGGVADPLFEPLITLLLKMVFDLAVAEGFEPPDGFSRLS
jgi:hypothetical protein